VNVGVLVTSEARKKIGDDVLSSLFENSDTAYVAEVGEHVFQDLKDNSVRALLLVGVEESVLNEIEQRVGISPLAMNVIPLSWVSGKSQRYVRALLMAYVTKASRSQLAYRVQPVRSRNVSRRSLLQFKFYEYVPHPVLGDELRVEKEINKCIEACPKGLVVKTPDGPQVTKPEDCAACGYCAGSSSLGYLESPTFSTSQFVGFVNTIVENYGTGKILFSCKPTDVREGVFPVVLPCVAYLHDSFVLASYAAGLEPIVYLPEDCKTRDMGMKRLEEMPSHFPGSKLEIFKVFDGEKLKAIMDSEVKLTARKVPEDVAFSRTRKRGLLLWALRAMKDLPLDEEAEVPSTFFVVVDTEKCVLCGVCVRECQMLVPQVRSQGGELLLEYDQQNCIGSSRCVKGCPEKAITVVKNAKIGQLTKTVYTKTKVGKCKYCGKPLGSYKVQDKVAVMLNGRGFKTDFVDVCNDCKQKELTKMWLQRLGKL